MLLWVSVVLQRDAPLIAAAVDDSEDEGADDGDSNAASAAATGTPQTHHHHHRNSSDGSSKRGQLEGADVPCKRAKRVVVLEDSLGDEEDEQRRSPESRQHSNSHTNDTAQQSLDRRRGSGCKDEEDTRIASRDEIDDIFSLF